MSIRSSFLGTLAVLAVPALAAAQAPAAPAPARLQIISAAAPLPADFRETATVLGYETGKKGLIELRKGTGPFTCLADDPSDGRFHVACYHKSLEAFMARGRELRANGVTAVDSVRNAEIAAKKLAMPNGPAALYSLTGTPETFNAATGEVTGARALFVMYVPFATAESTGLATRPAGSSPWIMNAGTPKAHIMFTPTM